FLLAGERVRAVDLEDGRDRAGEGIRARLQHAERCGIGREPGGDRETVMVVRVVGGGIGREAARGPVLEALVDRQDYELARAAQTALHQDARQIGLGPRRVALVVVEDLLDALGQFHRDFLRWRAWFG